MSASFVTPVVNALTGGGINGGVGLWVANWSITETQAITDVLDAAGPFPVIGVQFTDPGPFDVSVFSRDWLATQAGHPAPPVPPVGPVPPWQEAMMRALPTLRQGATGADVRTVQALCVARGHATVVDGAFGNATHLSVLAAQRSAGITQDGTVGPVTWNYLVSGSVS
jgi:hypothetical protein